MSYCVKAFVTRVASVWDDYITAEQGLERFLNDHSNDIHRIVQIFSKKESIVLVYEKKDKGGSAE